MVDGKDKWFWQKLFLTMVMASIWSSLIKDCIGTKDAHAGGYSISESAARMAKSLEDISATLNKQRGEK